MDYIHFCETFKGVTVSKVENDYNYAFKKVLASKSNNNYNLIKLQVLMKSRMYIQLF